MIDLLQIIVLLYFSKHYIKYDSRIQSPNFKKQKSEKVGEKQYYYK